MKTKIYHKRLTVIIYSELKNIFLNRLKVESKPFISSEFINLLKRKLEIYRETFGSTASLERVDNEMQKLIQFTLNKIMSTGF